jgi:4-hydroxy-2-oxoheptanedioate aldolase
MRPRVNRTKQKLMNGEVVYGIFVTIPAPRVVELCGIAGFDYVIIDAEHGPMDFGVCENLVRAAEAANITPLIRVPSHEPKTILRYLDIGAMGIMAPQVNSAADARAVVSAVKYAPEGTRGFGPGRSAQFGIGEPMSEYAANENKQTLIIAQLENVAALDELGEIIRTPGIDAFEIGTGDLSASMGMPGQSSRPEVQAVVQQFVTAVLGAGSVIGDTVTDGPNAIELYDQGYRMLDCSFDALTRSALGDLLGAAQSALQGR